MRIRSDRTQIELFPVRRGLTGHGRHTLATLKALTKPKNYPAMWRCQTEGCGRLQRYDQPFSRCGHVPFWEQADREVEMECQRLADEVYHSTRSNAA